MSGRHPSWIILIFGIIIAQGVSGQGITSDWTCISAVREVYSRVNTDAQFPFDVSSNLPEQPGIRSFQIVFYSGKVLGNVVFQYQGSMLTDPVVGVTISADATGKINVTLKDVKRSDKGTYRIYSASGTLGCICLYVLGIPKKPTISVNSNPSLGGTTTLTCRSSSTTTPSNHSLSLMYSWKVDNVNNPTGSRYSYSTNRNTLTLSKIVKQDASKQLTCLATEIVSNGYSSKRSNSYSFDFPYPPDGPPVITGYTDGGEYRVIEGTQGQLSCSVSGGNPVPTLTWDCLNSGTPQTSSPGTVTKAHSWTAERGQDKTCSCRASHYNGNTTVSIRIKILYPPANPALRINSTTVSGTVNVIRHNSLTITCSSEGQPPPSYKWTYPNGTTSNGAQIFVSSVQNNGRYTCEVQNTMNASASATVSGRNSSFINVLTLYPPTIPTFKIKSSAVSGTVEVIRGNSLSVICSSEGQPEPSYKWTYPNKTTRSGKQLSVSSVQNNGIYTCEVQNTMNPSIGDTVSSSNSSYIDVLTLYPPSLPTFKYWNKSGENITTRSLYVIKGDTFKVACMSIGEPAPNYQWINASTNEILTVNSITADQNRTCKARNTMVETVGQTIERSATALLKINVMYPPSAVTIKYHYAESSVVIVTSTLSIIENNPFTVTCRSDSNPLPSYKWNGTVSSNSTTVRVKRTRRSQAGTIACVVENTMTRTFANPEKRKAGRTMKSFNLQVLYPPVIGDLNNKSIVEGSPSTVTCPVTVGNPPETMYEWRRNGQVWKRTKEFTIGTTSRIDAMVYTCRVFNRMKQTGNQQISQPDTKSFYLNIWYSASVTEFYIVGHKGETSVTMNENETVLFECKADSNPGSTLSVIYQGNVAHFQTNIKSLKYNITSAVCTDTGLYSCEGFNQYSENISSKNLSLFINCKPRPAPYVTLKENVTSALHMPAVLTFTVEAYPEPNNTDFRWFRLNRSVWLPVSDNEQFRVETLNLQTNLTITDVHRTYFGMYKLEVRNAVGSHEQIFHLLPEGVPEQPRDFQYTAELVSKSSVTVQWTPGFDNGPDQTFILGYKSVSDNEWRTISIPDTGQTTMNYTISGLLSGKEYHAILYAVNALGNSTETEILAIKTKDDSTTGSYVVVGIAVGGSAFAVVVLVFIGVFMIRRHMTEKAKKMTEDTDAYVSNNDYVVLQPRKIYVNTSQYYDVLQRNSEDVQPVDVHKSHVYENLKL